MIPAVKIILFALILVMPMTAHASRKETVVLLHGIGHTKWNMFATEKALRKQGYEILNISYPSLRNDTGTLATLIHERLIRAGAWENMTKVNFVTHSMGGLVVRCYLEQHKKSIPSEKLGRVIMMAPPNGGSEVADLLKDFFLYKWIYGPAGQELTTEEQSKHTAMVYYELGIIAGTTGWPYILGNLAISGKHDGRVAVEKTKMAGMKDYIALPATHSFMAWKSDVHEQIISFLEEGFFQHYLH